MAAESQRRPQSVRVTVDARPLKRTTREVAPKTLQASSNNGIASTAPLRPRSLRRGPFKTRMPHAANQRGKTVWPSGLRRWLKAPFRKGVGSNPTAVSLSRTPFLKVVAAEARSLNEMRGNSSAQAVSPALQKRGDAWCARARSIIA